MDELERRRNAIENIGIACREVTAGCANVSQRGVIEYADLAALEEALRVIHHAAVQLLDNDRDTGLEPPPC